MTYINNTIMLIEEEIGGNLSNKHNSKIQDKQIWKSLRTHILSRREQNKQAEADAEVLRKKKRVEYQKMQENKLSLAQINGRLSQLRDKRDELEEEKRALLNQSKTTDDTSQATDLIVPKSESNCELGNIKPIVTNNTSNAMLSNHRQPLPLLQKQQPHMFRQQITTNAQPGAVSPAASSGLRPLSQQSLIPHNSNNKNTTNSNQTLLVCSPAAINAGVANNQNSIVTSLSTSLAASLSSTISFTKYSSLYSSSTSHLLPPNVGTSNKMGRIPSPQTYQQQQNVVPYSTPMNKYQPMNCGMNNVHSAITTPVVNNINQALTTVTNSNYPIENASRHGSREDTSPSFNRNVWINNNCNNINKNSHPNVSNYGSFYQPSSTEAINYCINNGMSSLSPSISSVNTVYSYSGPPHTRTESSGNLLVSVSNDHTTLQIPKPVSSLHYNHGHSHPPLYMSPGIRNQTSINHPYHPKPSHGAYSDEKLVSTTPNFYQPQNNRNVVYNTTNTTTVSSIPHQMSQKPHNIGYSLRHSTPSPASQLSPAPPNTSSYNGPTCSASGYSNKSSIAVSISDVSRYPPSSQIPISRHD